MPFLVGAGDLLDSVMSAGSISLSGFWGGEFRKFSCNQTPNQVIASISKKEGIFQLSGDAASFDSKNGSWLQALAAWRSPIILMASPLSNGNFPGATYAYAALCNELSVPLIGIIQLGGFWDPKNRIMDGLPWCGWLSIQNSLELVKNQIENELYPMTGEEVCENLRLRLLMLNL